MLGDGYHAVVGDLSSGRLGREIQISLNHIFQLILGLLHGLVDDDPVHGAAEVQVDFLKDSGCVNAR